MGGRLTTVSGTPVKAPSALGTVRPLAERVSQARLELTSLSQKLDRLPWSTDANAKAERAQLTKQVGEAAARLEQLTGHPLKAAAMPGPATPPAAPDPSTLQGLRTLSNGGAPAPLIKAWAENNFGPTADWAPQTISDISTQASQVVAELQHAGKPVPPGLQAMANLPQAAKARGALEAYSSGSQVLLDAVSRQGYGEFADAAKALKNNLVAMLGGPRSENEGSNLRVNDAGRAILRDQVALASLKRGIEDGTLSPQSFGKKDWKDVDLLAEAAKLSGDGKFDAKGEAAKLAQDPDFAQAQLRIKDEDGAPVALLDFKELNSWGRLVKSSQEWLREGGTKDNMSYWHGLPVVKQLREQTRAATEVEGPQREATLRLGTLRTGLSMAAGGALNARLEPDLLVNAARAAGVSLTEPRSFQNVGEAQKAVAAGGVSKLAQAADGTWVGEGPKSPESLCRDLQQALGRTGPLDALSATERKTLTQLVGPKESPGADFAKRVSKEHWQAFWRTVPDMVPAVVAGAVVTAAAAPGIAAAGLGTAGAAVVYGAVGAASGAALDLALEGRAPTPESLIAGAALGWVSSSASAPIANALSKQLLSKAGTNVVAQAVAGAVAKAQSNVLSSAASTSLNHFVTALKAGAPLSPEFKQAFSKNFEEDLLKSMLSAAVGQGVSAGLASLDSAAKRLEDSASLKAGAKELEVAARQDAADHLRATRRARDAYSAAVKEAEGIMAAVPNASPAEAQKLAKDYTWAVASMKETGTTLQKAVSQLNDVLERLPPQDAAKLKTQLGAQAKSLNDAMQGLPATAVPAPAEASKVARLSELSAAEKATEAKFAKALEVQSPPAAASAKPAALPALPSTQDPTKVARLSGLNEAERAIEAKFANAFEAHPTEMVAELRARMKAGQIGDNEFHFSPDEAKKLSPDFTGGARAKELANKLKAMKAGGSLSAAEVQELDAILAKRAMANLPTHPTAEKIAFAAFAARLDEMKANPAGPQEVIIPVGGMGAGKSYAIQNVGRLKDMAGRVGATWDGAGENPDVLKILAEVDKRGLKATVVFVDNDPLATLTATKRGVVDRAINTGRMSSLQLLGPSYKKSAEAMLSAEQQFGGNPRIQFAYIDNRASPTEVAGLRPEALKLNVGRVYEEATTYLQGRTDLPGWLRSAAIDVGNRIWPGGSP